MFGTGCLKGLNLFPDTDQGERIQFYDALGVQLGRTANYDEALCEMGKAVPEVEQLRTVVDEPRFRRSLFKSTVDVYGDLVGLLFDSQNSAGLKIPAELMRYGSEARSIAFRFAEAARARTFVERLGPALATSYNVKDDRFMQLRENERQTRTSLRALLDFDSLPSNRPEVTSQEARRIRMISLRQQLDAIVQQIRAVNPAFATLLYPDPIGMQDVRDLGGADALVEYMVTQQEVYCWVITRSGESQWFRFNVTRNDLRSSVADLRDPMEQRDQQFDHALSQSLYQTLLVEPLKWLAAHLPAGATANELRLAIVPDDALYLLPFEILENTDGQFLAESYITSYSPSATALEQLKTVSQSTHWTSKLLLVGDSLTDSKPLTVPGISRPFSSLKSDSVAINDLSSLFGESKDCVDVLTGACSGKKTLLARGQHNELKGYQYVHFTTHAFAYSRYPEPSLVLFPVSDNFQDALLSMSEIPALNLQAQLVTLSACQSALGQERDPIPGEGIVGLTQAFFYAGAQSVVSSLWEVEGVQTEKLMKTFYTQLQGSAANDRAKALFLARKEVREPFGPQNKLSPYLWGAFVLYGAQRPVPHQNVIR
jgi:CHAT domain-containing protein